MTTTKKPEFHWCYTDPSCGEEQWKIQYPVSYEIDMMRDSCLRVLFQTCAGQSQSPINIDFASTTATAKHPTGGALMFTGYDKVKTSVTIKEECIPGVDCDNTRDLKNNGHTAVSFYKLKRRRRREMDEV